MPFVRTIAPFDEAPNTLEYSTYYTVQPAFNWWKTEDHIVRNGERGRAMKGDWQYRSFGNSEVLSAEQLRRLLEEDRDHARSWQPAA